MFLLASGEVVDTWVARTGKTKPPKWLVRQLLIFIHRALL
jgi:hypothetical protein